MRKTILIGAATLAMMAGSALVALPAQAASTTWYVDQTDGMADSTGCGGTTAAFTTIAQAVTAASDGDTISVCPGTYNEATSTAKSLEFLGAQFMVDAEYPRSGAETIVDGLNSTAFNLDGANSVVSGFTIKSTGAAANVPAVYAAGVNAAVLNNIFDSNQIALISNTSGLSFTNNDVMAPSSGGAGLDLYGAEDDTTVQFNAFKGKLSGNGVSLSPSATVTDFVLKGNLVDLTGGGGFAQLSDVTSPSVTENVITGDADSSDGIQLTGGVTDPVISNNTVKGLSAASGIQFDFPFGGTTQDSGGTVNSNDLEGNLVGLNINDLTPTSTLEAHGNILIGNTSSGITETVAGAATVDATNNYWGCNEGPGNSGCDTTIKGGMSLLTTAPYAELRSGVAMSTIAKGSTTGFTADLTHNNLGDVMSNLVPDNALTAAFSFDLGTASPVSAPIVGGLAGTIITGTTAGTAFARVAVANSLSKTSVTVTAPTNPTLPALTIHDGSVLEGNSGTHALTFKVTMSKKATKAVTVHFTTANGSAVGGSDFVAKSGVLTIAKGKTSGTITILVKGDKAKEPNETFYVNIFTPTNARIADSVGQGTIRNDDH